MALAGVATAIEGVRIARQAPAGAVPLAEGDHIAPEATRAQERIKRRLSALGLVSLAAELALKSWLGTDLAGRARLKSGTRHKPP